MNTMNDDPNTPQPQPWIDPAVEARIVADVLGETSAFEQAELARLLAENPELALFKRRIEAVQGLVKTAAGPDSPRLQLGAERRKALLETLGVPAGKAKKPIFTLPAPAWWTAPVWIRLAASVVVGAVFVSFLSSVMWFRSGEVARNEEGFADGEAGFVLAEGLVPSPPVTAPRPVSPTSATRGLPEKMLVASGVVTEVSPVGAVAMAPPQISTAPEVVVDPAVDLMKNPSVTVRSGQQAKTQVVREFSSPSEFAERQEPKDERAVAQPMIADAEPSQQVAVHDGESVAVGGMTASSATAIKVFTGGWGKGAGSGTGVRDADKNQPLAVATPSSMAAPTSESSAFSADAVDALLFGDQPPSYTVKKEYSSNVINQPVFSSRNGVPEFDGFIHYGSPITAPEVEGTDKRLEAARELTVSGRQDLAYKYYEQVLAADPYNIEARRGMDEVMAVRPKFAGTAIDEARSRMLEQVDIGWELPVRRFHAGGSVIIETPRVNAKALDRKLDEILIPRIEFQDTTLREALEFLQKRAAALDSSEEDPTRKGLNIVLKLPTDAPQNESRMTFSLTDIPLRQALQYVADASNMKLKVEPYAVAVMPLSEASASLVLKEYHVPPELLSSLEAKEYLRSLGVPFPAGASAHYLASSSKLIVKNTSANLGMIDVLLDVPAKLPASAALARPPHLLVDEILTSKQPFSTFSLKVSDVSFQLARDALNKGTRPEPERIRTEEFYNALDYNDPAPGPGEEVACRIETGRHPFLQQRDLVRIAVKVAAAGRAAGQPLRLTILLDTSGSMEREDRAASVRQALKTLAGLLGPDDRVNLIGFARTPRLLAEQVPGDQAGTLVEIAARTPSEGGTDLEQALALASEQALKHRLPAAQNRIVLLTDGAANLGDADPVRLARQIESTRQQGISFDACGVGARGLNDEILEALTRKGDGRYYFLNTPGDADAGFARQLAGALRPAAENVKVQVVFNPTRVHQYRLLGFENHLLKREDFRNDAVQAAELSAEEAGVALYQVETLPEGEGELGQVFVRFRDPATGRMVERSWTMPYAERIPAFDQAPSSLQLSAVAALLAEKLRGDDRVDLNALAPVLTRLREQYPHQVRVAELIRMVEQVRAGQAP